MTTVVPPRDGYGDSVFQTHCRDDGNRYITCEHADPRIRISDVLLHQIAAGEGDPGAVLTLADGRPPTGKPDRPADLFGAVLAFHCANRHLVYRITGWAPVWLEGDDLSGSYLAEWPD